MVALILTSTIGFSTKTSCANDILLITPTSNLPVSKDSLVIASDFKISQLSGSLNIKHPVKTPSLDWSSLQDLFDLVKKIKKTGPELSKTPPIYYQM